MNTTTSACEPFRDIKTVPELRRAIKIASIILVMPCFGTSERWVVISKKEATQFTKALPDDISPEEYEMGTNSFGNMAGKVLYIG